MSQPEDEMIIRSIEELEQTYGPVNPRALVKEIDYISDHYRAFIEAAPFAVLATIGPDGTDCSPRGDAPGFVRVTSSREILIPDRRGNNRLDTLRNIVLDGRISVLFLIPGIGETLRINGHGVLSNDPDLCESFAINGKAPASVLKIRVSAVYFQCQKALVRSRLWDKDSRIERNQLPTAGQILQALDKSGFDGDEYDRNYPEHMKKTIY